MQLSKILALPAMFAALATAVPATFRDSNANNAELGAFLTHINAVLADPASTFSISRNPSKRQEAPSSPPEGGNATTTEPSTVGIPEDLANEAASSQNPDADAGAETVGQLDQILNTCAGGQCTRQHLTQLKELPWAMLGKHVIAIMLEIIRQFKFSYSFGPQGNEMQVNFPAGGQ